MTAPVTTAEVRQMNRFLRLLAVALGVLGARDARAEDAACAVRYNQSVLSARIALAEESFLGDPAAFSTAAAEMEEALDCLSDPIGTKIAARVHRVRALVAHGAGQTDVAMGSLMSSKALDPDFKFPTGYLPANHDLSQAYGTLTVSGRRHHAPLPREGTLAFDGLATRAYPADRPTVAQLLDPNGKVTWTELVSSGEQLPEYAVFPRTRIVLASAAGGSIVVSAATFALSRLAAAKFDKPTTDTLEDLERARSSANTFASLSLTTGVLAVGSGVAAVAVGNR
jgi:hypothetical protein